MILRFLIKLGGVLAIAWMVGLLFFVSGVEKITEPPRGPALETTDVIVVLTGGSDRVSTGIELLKAHKAKKLFISGVHPGHTLEHVIENQQVPKDLQDCCIVLGHAAESTLGNAEETLNWLDLENAHSVRLVTANYHMPRTLLVFRSILPGSIEIVPHPVAPESVVLEGWWMHPGTASLLVTEYTKYIGTIVRLWFENRL